MNNNMLKSKDVHNGFSEKEVRDFLGRTIHENCIAGSVETIEQKIRDLQSELERAKKYEAAKCLIKEKGWICYDVSDNLIDYDGYIEDGIFKGNYLGFVGTEGELRELLGKVEYEKYRRITA